MKFCTNCLMPSTRPRIQYNQQGVCNACQWADEKKTIDWSKRWAKLESLCEKYRSRNKGKFDVIVPYSGGKNGAYIAYILKHQMNMNPLCITIRPPMEDKIGLKNIKNFQDLGYDHLFVTPNRQILRDIDKENFIEKGIPMHAFMITVQTAILRCAQNFDIPFVMYAEEGETEYGGSSKLKESATYSVEDSINLYLSGVDPKKYISKFSEKELYWFLYPSADELRTLMPEVCHWSYFEDFVNYKHYLVAKEKCGLIEREERNIGAIENFSILDTDIIHLYFYLMYLKFGFGRTISEVGNEIRRGAMTRSQAVNIARKFDGEYPEKHLKSYLSYYDMTQEEFDLVLDKWANKDLFEKINNRWKPKFKIE